MPIKAIAFDLGGVIASLGTSAAHRRWEKRLGLRERTLLDRVWASPISQRAMIGLASGEEVWLHTQATFGLTDADIAALMHDLWPNEMDQELLGYIRSLRPRFKTALISNAYVEMRQLAAEWINGQVFDEILISAEEGLAKPDPAIYVRALERLAVRAEETIFVDDLAPNVEAARSIGMQALLFRGADQIQCDIARIAASQADRVSAFRPG